MLKIITSIMLMVMMMTMILVIWMILVMLMTIIVLDDTPDCNVNNDGSHMMMVIMMMIVIWIIVVMLMTIIVLDDNTVNPLTKMVIIIADVTCSQYDGVYFGLEVSSLIICNSFIPLEYSLVGNQPSAQWASNNQAAWQ